MGPLAVFMKQNRREPVDLNAVSRVDRGNSIPHSGMAHTPSSLPYAKGYR